MASPYVGTEGGQKGSRCDFLSMGMHEITDDVKQRAMQENAKHVVPDAQADVMSRC
jgi:hypothetical protein